MEGLFPLFLAHSHLSSKWDHRLYEKLSCSFANSLAVLPEHSPEVTAHLLVEELALHTDQCVTTQDCDFSKPRLCMTTTGINYHLTCASRREVRCFAK